jgi:hypothetical protein
MFTEQEEKAFIVVDNFLKELSASDNGGWFNTYGASSDRILAKELLDKYGLITYRSTNRKTSIIDISQEGLRILKAGGLKKYLSDTIEYAEQKEKMQYEKLNAELIDIRNKIFDYDSTKKRAIRGEWIAALGLLLSAIAILITLLSKRSG